MALIESPRLGWLLRRFGMLGSFAQLGFLALLLYGRFRGSTPDWLGIALGAGVLVWWFAPVPMRRPPGRGGVQLVAANYLRGLLIAGAAGWLGSVRPDVVRPDPVLAVFGVFLVATFALSRYGRFLAGELPRWSAPPGWAGYVVLAFLARPLTRVAAVIVFWVPVHGFRLVRGWGAPFWLAVVALVCVGLVWTVVLSVASGVYQVHAVAIRRDTTAHSTTYGDGSSWHTETTEQYTDTDLTVRPPATGLQPLVWLRWAGVLHESTDSWGSGSGAWGTSHSVTYAHQRVQLWQLPPAHLPLWWPLVAQGIGRLRGDRG
ncbi:hypothetical protein ABTZ03_40425 [Kitasatospora sp. NPDC096077]|uniref:hypothetical protein n=1 Tax=Kitasatospora sp. NPDC096077 TaxID=3155544 RepID=UPI003324FC5C